MRKWIAWWQRTLSLPSNVRRIVDVLCPWTVGIALLPGYLALYGCMLLAPVGHQQGYTCRTVFLPVISAGMILLAGAVLIVLTMRGCGHCAPAEALSDKSNDVGDG